MSNVAVQIAIYGALDTATGISQAANVTTQLQAAINQTKAVVLINNTTMGGDPCVNYVKCFAAQVVVNGVTQYFACAENETIDFLQTSASAAAKAG